MRAVIFYMAVLAALPLAGCTSKSVATVKNTPSENKNFTLGEVLSNRTFCDKTKWRDSKNDAGDTIVEYSCVGTIGRDVTDKLQSATRENVEGRVKFLTDQFLNKENNARIGYEHAQSYQAEVDASAAEVVQQVAELNELKAEPLEGRTVDEKKSMEVGIWRLERRLENTQARDKALQEGLAKQLAEATALKQHIAGMKDAYLADLQAARAADLKAIDKLYPEPSKIEQKVFFVVDGDRSRVVRLEFYVDGKSVAVDSYRQLFIFRSELTTPKGPQPLADWNEWWSQMVERSFRSQTKAFERRKCHGQLPCEEPVGGR